VGLATTAAIVGACRRATPDAIKKNAILDKEPVPAAETTALCGQGVGKQVTSVPEREVDVSEAVNIGTRKQLFIDDHIVDSMDRAYRILNQPVKHPGNPIIEFRRPQPVEGDELVIVGGSVIYDEDEGLLKMWYSGTNYHWKNGFLAYATSEDGVEWDLPNLDLIKCKSAENRNFVLHRDGEIAPCVFKDPAARDPERRYKLLYSCGRGMGIAFSPDGIHWNPVPNKTVITVADSPTSCIWDPRLGRYVAHTRHNYRGGAAHSQRQVLQSESKDFVDWYTYGVIMKADEQDPPWNQQFYNMEWMPYEDVYLGFISVYHILPGMEPKITPGAPWMDKIDIQLSFSRDDRTWHRAGDRQVFIPNGASPEDFDWGMIYVFQRPVVVGDEILFYYAGFDGLHWATRRNELQGGAIGLAKLRLDGFVSIDAGDGVLQTKLMAMSGDRLIVNADASLGHIRVEVVDAEGEPIEGFGKDDAHPITGDSVRHEVRWKGRTDVRSLMSKPIALRFVIDRSKVYSFQFQAT